MNCRFALLSILLSGCGATKGPSPAVVPPFHGAEYLRFLTADMMMDGGSIAIGTRANCDEFFYLEAECPMAAGDKTKPRRIYWMRTLSSVHHEIVPTSAEEHELLALLQKDTDIDPNSLLPKETVTFFRNLVQNRYTPWPRLEEWPKMREIKEIEPSGPANPQKAGR